jgi:hypothetical protein
MVTKKRSMPTYRLGGLVLVLALMIMVTGASIPFFAPSLRDAPWTDDPELAAKTIAGNPRAAAWANGLFLAAAVVTALGLVPVSLGFQGKACLWAGMAFVAFAFAAVCSVIDRVISIEVFTWGAVQGLQVTDPLVGAFVRFSDGLAHLFNVLAYIALAMYGIALLRLPSPSGLGVIFVVGGSLGLILHLVGETIPAFIYFGFAALGASIWWAKIVPEA